MEVYSPESLTSETNAPDQTENNITLLQIDNNAGIGGNMQSVARICEIMPKQLLEPAVAMSMLDERASNVTIQIQKMQNALQ